MKNKNLQNTDHKEQSIPEGRKPFRYRQYDKLDISIVTMDKIITVLVVLLLVAFALGIVLK